uniref:methionine gamma-lyase n=1 Tax=Ndongobacter massiliensis TaxID=1871025 RepID=UPI0009303111|nr:methionine gamma-lyase [Ndongobacter massiliensis]
MNLKNAKFDTLAVHAGYVKNDVGALTTPIYQTSTFIFDNAAQGGRRFAGQEEGYIYSRLGNPTVAVAEDKLAVLEKGEACVAMASGMGAISSVLWTFLSAGDQLIAGETLYGCTFALMAHSLTRMGIEVTFVDTTDPENVRKAMTEKTKMVYLETPVNPSLTLADIKKISEIAHKQEGVRVVVDNTFATPVCQRPLELGADIVVHSATKYINGHGDVIAGFAIGTKEDMMQVRMVGVKDCTGSVMSPFNAFLLVRGMKTMGIRVHQHVENAKKVAAFLEKHPKVTRVNYPGLDSFPQKALADEQMDLPGAMLSFEIDGGVKEGAKVMDSVQLCTLAVSLGDCETLIEHPASMTHSTYTAEERAEAGIKDNLIRLSVGLEDPDDIIADLDQALAQI